MQIPERQTVPNLAVNQLITHSDSVCHGDTSRHTHTHVHTQHRGLCHTQ